VVGNRRIVEVTLNYDDLIERVTSDWFDGFDNSKQVSRFDSGAFVKRYRGREILCHLHGCMNFGVSRYDGMLEIVKYKRPYALPDPPLLPAFMGTAQSGETTTIGPIISGLRKTDKTYYPPYGFYQKAFVEGLTSSPHIVVVGYGAHDTYVNSWLLQARRSHRQKLRVGIVTRRVTKPPQSDVVKLARFGGKYLVGTSRRLDAAEPMNIAVPQPRSRRHQYLLKY
jgi:hypothetical protein